MTRKSSNNTPSPRKKTDKDRNSDRKKNEKLSKATDINQGQSSHHTDVTENISNLSHISPQNEIVSTKTHPRTKVCRKLGMVPALPPVPHLPVCSVSHYPSTSNRNFSYPVTANDWNALMTNVQYPRMPNYHYSMPYQHVQMFNPIPVLASPICPYSALLTPPILGPVLPAPMTIKDVQMRSGYKNIHYSPEQIVPSKKVTGHSQTVTQANISADETMYDMPGQSSQDVPKDDTDYFLTLPKNIFPTVRMLQLDPNPMIDELCKLTSVHTQLSWMLDLEFGVPRGPITRPIPIYDVKFNSIHCKNTPNAVHPGFESCSDDFKRVLLFYYDSVISTWYRGYVLMHSDHSVENFQSWLLLAMQMFGMCWP